MKYTARELENISRIPEFAKLAEEIQRLHGYSVRRLISQECDSIESVMFERGRINILENILVILDKPVVK